MPFSPHSQPIPPSPGLPVPPPELVSFIKNREAWRAKPYLDVAGLPTIGYGHRIPSLDHEPLTEDEGLELLASDIHQTMVLLDALHPAIPLWTEPPARWSAIVDFAFNCGVPAYAGSHLRRAVEGEDWAAAAAQIVLWCHARNPITHQLEVQPGLLARREAEAQWLVSGAFE
jgi:lysozyme